jgi:hypothetical protein
MRRDSVARIMGDRMREHQEGACTALEILFGQRDRHVTLFRSSITHSSSVFAIHDGSPSRHWPLLCRGITRIDGVITGGPYALSIERESDDWKLMWGGGQLSVTCEAFSLGPLETARSPEAPPRDPWSEIFAILGDAGSELHEASRLALLEAVAHCAGVPDAIGHLLAAELWGLAQIAESSRLKRAVVHLLLGDCDGVTPIGDMAELYLHTHGTPLLASEYGGASSLLHWVDNAAYWRRFRAAFGRPAVVAASQIHPKPEWLAHEDVIEGARIDRHRLVWHTWAVCDEGIQVFLTSSASPLPCYTSRWGAVCDWGYPEAHRRDYLIPRGVISEAESLVLDRLSTELSRIRSEADLAASAENLRELWSAFAAGRDFLALLLAANAGD